MIRKAIFDLDGTLIDTSEGIIESVKYAVQKMNYPGLNNDELVNFIGPPLKDSFLRYLVKNEVEAEIAVRYFREYYANGGLLKAKPYDGICGLLELLSERNVNLSVATYKLEKYAIKMLKFFKIDSYFKSIHGSDADGRMKKKEIVQLCLDDMSEALDEAVLIGDTSNDEKAAEELGMSFLAVTYGFGYRSPEKVNYRNCIGVADCPLKIGEIIMES
mgnify:CR=1 FL=1